MGASEAPTLMGAPPVGLVGAFIGVMVIRTSGYHRPARGRGLRLTAALKQTFIAGLILLAPLVVTVYVLWVLAIWSMVVVKPGFLTEERTRSVGSDVVDPDNPESPRRPGR